MMFCMHGRLPSFGVKRDAVPGRINETWFKAEKVGTYYGQCSELCGIKHAFMPITVRVVSEEDYAEWLTGAKIKFAKEPLLENDNIKLASKLICIHKQHHTTIITHQLVGNVGLILLIIKTLEQCI